MASSAEEVTDPWEMHRRLDSSLVRFTEAFLNEHPGRVTNPAQYGTASRRFLDLRTSVLYRFESLALHIDLIKRREDACMKELEKDIFRNDRIEVVRWASRDMKFLFDDIVFSTISLFDYLGNMIGFVLLKLPKKNLNWKGVIEWVKSGGGPTSRTGPRSNELNDEWIAGIARYRHVLIHHTSDTSGGRLRHNIADGQAALSVSITVPAAFVKQIEHLRQTVPDDGMGVLSAGLWIVGQTFDAGVELVGTLRTDLGLTT
jgi:hypothetical protein